MEESAFLITPDTELQLVFNDRLVPMIDKQWTNPYNTFAATGGHCLFWPDFIKGEMDTVGDNILR